MICAKSFPGWRNFEAFVSHLKFTAAHHRQIERIAVVTESGFLKIMPHIAGLLVQPKVRHFDLDEKDRALAWLGVRIAGLGALWQAVMLGVAGLDLRGDM
jgi:hypothetical protein